MLHGRCRATETTLREIIVDLQEQLRAERARLDTEREASSARERDLYERALAVNQPAVYANTRSSVPPLPATSPLPPGLRLAPGRMRMRSIPVPTIAPNPGSTALASTTPATGPIQPQVIEDESLIDPAASGQ